MFVDMSTPQGPQKETRGPRQGLERTDSSGRSRDRGTTHTTHSWGLFLHPARVPRDHPWTLRGRAWSCPRASVSSVHKNREGELLPDPEAEWHPPGTPALVMSDSLTTFRERVAYSCELIPVTHNVDMPLEQSSLTSPTKSGLHLSSDQWEQEHSVLTCCYTLQCPSQNSFWYVESGILKDNYALSHSPKFLLGQVWETQSPDFGSWQASW